MSKTLEDVAPTSPFDSSTTLHTFSSESVTEGHPDKVCDYIADSILDSYLAQDKQSRVACEVLCKNDRVVLAGEITSNAVVNHEEVVRQAIREIGYTDPGEAFNSSGVQVHQFLTRQAGEIAQGVESDKSLCGEQGAGDQGIMFGYATNETPELMPLPILLAHRLAAGLAQDRRSGSFPWLRPDGKSQVSVVYQGNTPVRVSDVLISTQHSADVDRENICRYVAEVLAPRVLGEWCDPAIRFLVNPTGSFVHGGGAFSGKDPSKVDRSGAYFCRYIARQIVRTGLASRAEVQVAYAIGMSQPISVKVDTFGTGDAAAAAEYVKKNFDFRPARIIERLDLLRPIFRQTTNYGHFGRPGLPWEG